MVVFLALKKRQAKNSLATYTLIGVVERVPLMKGASVRRAT